MAYEFPSVEAFSTVHVSPVVTSAGSRGFYATHIKRMLDLVLLAMLALPVLVTLCTLAALIARDGSSPLYVQERVGRYGRVFRMWKLRSMVPDADAKLAAHLAQNPTAREEWDTYQKLQKDPRVTPIGRIIRATSLDELPQLWNVLTGEMSLIGPRPMLPEQQFLYPGSEYYRMRPGLTGLWQVSQRHHSTFADRARFDREYGATLSFTNDVRILLRTIAVVLRRTGV